MRQLGVANGPNIFQMLLVIGSMSVFDSVDSANKKYLGLALKVKSLALTLKATSLAWKVKSLTSALHPSPC